MGGNALAAPAARKIAYFPKAYLHIVAKSLEERCGIDYAKECESRGLPIEECIADPLGISRSLLESFERCTFELAQDRPEVWTNIGLRMRLAAYGIVGLTYLTSPNMNETMNVCSEFRGLTISLADHFYEGRDDSSGGQHFDLTNVAPELREFTIVRDVASSMACTADLWTGAFPYSKVLIASAYENVVDALRPLDIPIEITDSTTALIWKRNLEGKPLFNADEKLHSIYVEECRRMQATRDLDPFVDRATRAIEATLIVSPDDLTLTRVARMLAISERTLQRRLGESGHSFRAMCDLARRHRAESLLASGRVSAADIAVQLGYSETSSFLHAFRRWNGKTPSEYRRKRLAFEAEN